MEIDADTLRQRLKELNISMFEIARRIAIKRNEGKTTEDYASMVRKVFKNPETAKYSTLQEIIEVMGGSIEVNWNAKK